MSGFAPTLIPASQADAWLDSLAGIEHGFGHRPEYALAASRVTGHETCLWSYRGPRGSAVCPVSMRPAPGGGFDIATPVGFSGFAVAGDVPDLAEVWTSDWRSRMAIAAYVQLSPARAPGDWQALLSPLSDWLHAGEDCYCLDLGPGEDELLAAMGSKHRQLLRKWLRDEADVVWDQALLQPAFDSLYRDFVLRRGIGAAYRYGPDAIASLAGAPGAFFVGARGADGAIEAVTLFLSAGAWGESFLNAANETGRRHSRGLYWLGALRLKEAGVRMLNLGGGVGSSEGLAEFKLRLGARRCPSLVLKQVFDPARYGQACALAGVQASGEGGFPAWFTRAI